MTDASTGNRITCTHAGCEKTYGTRKAMLQHLPAHEPEGRHQCPIQNCGSRYHREESCIRITMSHTFSQQTPSFNPMAHRTEGVRSAKRDLYAIRLGINLYYSPNVNRYCSGSNPSFNLSLNSNLKFSSNLSRHPSFKLQASGQLQYGSNVFKQGLHRSWIKT
ncbi:hypothetical protein F5Y18DRAFT_421515 [Xylariaceae sp. FL1019]|nr:hypothetical protein F5Y18DRAFT_421515 [Xylariaceae sp. FL1019]